MKKLLNKEIVEQAIADVKAAGDKPTIERIRKITGGSPKTIIAIKRLIDDNEHNNALSSNDNEHDNALSSNDNKHDNDYHNTLSSNDIKKLIDTSINQKLEQLKSELLDTIKKNDFDVNNSTPELVQENQDLHQQIKQQAETIEQLKADVIRLEEAKQVSESRSKEAEQARMDAVKEVVKFASENTELRSKLEPVGTTEPEQNDSKNEPEKKPEIKFTLKKAKARFFELCSKFPDKKQSDLIIILNSEGYKNNKGKQLVPSTVSRWHDEWEKKVGKKSG